MIGCHRTNGGNKRCYDCNDSIISPSCNELCISTGQLGSNNTYSRKDEESNLDTCLFWILCVTDGILGRSSVRNSMHSENAGYIPV